MTMRQSIDEFLQSIAPGMWDDDGGIHTAVNEVNAILDSHDDDEEHLLNVYTVGGTGSCYDARK